MIITGLLLRIDSYIIDIVEAVVLIRGSYHCEEKTLLWTASDENVTTVEPDGSGARIYGISVGAATITATAADESGVKA